MWKTQNLGKLTVCDVQPCWWQHAPTEIINIMCHTYNLHHCIYKTSTIQSGQFIVYFILPKKHEKTSGIYPIEAFLPPRKSPTQFRFRHLRRACGSLGGVARPKARDDPNVFHVERTPASNGSSGALGSEKELGHWNLCIHSIHILCTFTCLYNT